MNERIRKIREYFCDGSNAKFAKIMGISEQYASDMVSGRSVGNKKLSKILEKFPEVNPVWLKIGDGEMIKNNVNQTVNSGGICISGGTNSNIGNANTAELSKEELLGLLDRRSAEYQLDLKERFAYVQKKDGIIKQKQEQVDILVRQLSEAQRQIGELIEQNKMLTKRLLDL